MAKATETVGSTGSTALEMATGTTPFLVLNTPVEDVREIIQTALAGETLKPSDLQQIKVPAGGVTTWTRNTVDGEIETKVLQGVIIAHRPVRAYWAEAYGGENTPPQCYSDDAQLGHGTPGGACARCAFAEWGSAKGGTAKGQACKLMRLVFLLPPDSFLPVVLRLPPTSQNLAKGYVTNLAGLGVWPWSVMTDIELERTQNSGGLAYSRVVFKRTKGVVFNAETRARLTAYVEELRPALGRMRVDAGDFEGQTDADDTSGRGMPDATRGDGAHVTI